MGAGGAILIGAAITGAMTSAAEGELEDECMPRNECPEGQGFESTRNDGKTLQVVTNVLLGVGAATVVGGGLWWLLSPGDDAAPPATALCTPHGCHATIRAAF